MRFQIKIMLCVTLLLAGVFGMGNCILLNRTFESAAARERSSAYYNYQLVLYALDALESPNTSTAYADMHNTLYQLDAQGGGWLALRLKSGDIVIYNTPGGLQFQRDLEARTALNQCTTEIFSQNGAWYLQMTGRFFCGNTPYTLDAIYPLEELYRSREVQLYHYRVSYIVVVVLGAGISWLISHWLTGPLRSLSLVLKRITEGDLTCRAKITTRDEVGDLARDLNQMTRQLETNMEELRDTMHQQEEFMGSFAHEMKTPMTAIIGYADLLRSQTLSIEEQQEAANYIFHEGRRLERLSLKLLELFVSRKGDIERIPCRPKVLLEEVARMLEPGLAKEGIAFRYECANGVYPLDPDLIRSLFVNLIDNARKAIDGVGTIIVTGEVTQEWCRFQVQDTGRGMARGELKHIREPFYRVDKSRSRSQGGAGLGLALCSEIVKLHHGSIAIDSTPGQGTCVTVELRGGI